jgi:hypothetical protein
MKTKELTVFDKSCKIQSKSSNLLRLQDKIGNIIKFLR